MGNLKKTLDIDDDYIDYYELEREYIEKKLDRKILTIGEFRKAIR